MQRAKPKETNITYDYSKLTTRKKTDQVVIHHTGNPTDDDLGAEDINKSHRAQGWTCIGYHYVVRKDGTIEVGRPHWTVGAHAYGENSHTIGIHVSGNFELAEPTRKQIESLSLLVATICKDYGLDLEKKGTVVAHRDLMPTACCGKNLYKELPTVIGKAKWYQQH